MSTPDPAWRVKRTPCPFYQSGRCIFKHKCNFIHDGDINMRRSDVRAQVPVYRRTPENSVDSFSSSEEDEPVQEHRIDEHSAAAPSLVFSSIYGPRPNSINRLQLANVDLPVSPESLPHTPPRTSRPTSHHSVHNLVSITSPTPSRPLSSSLGIGIGGRAQGGLAEVFAAIANTQAQAQSTALPPSSAGSLPSPLSLSPKSPARTPHSPANDVQEIVIKDEGYSLEQLPFKLALSNQSSLLLNRTSRAAQRRSSTLPQRQDTSSSSGADREKRPTNLSAPERLSISSLPRHIGGRPISVSSVEQIEEEGQADDEQDEEEQEIVDESPSFEALQPYPRDVSTEPSPDPTKQGFIPPAPAPPPPAEQPPKPHARNNSARHIEHELVIDELEERLGVELARRRRARSNAVPNPAPSGTSPNRSTSHPTGRQADAVWERKPPIQMPGSNVDMGAARNMLSAMFAKRDQQVEERIEEHSSDEHSFLPVDWDVGSMAGLDEEDQLGQQEDIIQPEPAIVQQKSVAERRESVNARRQSTASQPRAPIATRRSSRPTPISQAAPQSEAHPQTPSTASSVPETPNTQITHSTQPTPPSDHGFEETDTEDEHPEDLADLIEAEPVVLRTPRSVVLRREVGRETSLSSRAGTGTGAWTPRGGSGTWTPRHGSVVGGSGGLQVIESPIVERRQYEWRRSVERSQPSPNERSESASEQQMEDITQSTISEASLNTVSGQTESMSPVSRPLVSDRASVSAPVAGPTASSAPILGFIPPSGNGLGLGLDSVPSVPLRLGSKNGSGSGVVVSDIVSSSPSVSPLSPVPPSGNVLGLSSVSPAPSGISSVVGSGPTSSEQVRQAAPATPVALLPVVPTPEAPVASASVSPARPTLEPSVPSSQSIIPPNERSIVPEPAPAAVPDPVPRAESASPAPKAKSVVLQGNSGSVPSVEPGPSSEPNLAARVNPSLVAGPDSKDDYPISHSLDRGSASIPVLSSESNGVPIEPIRDTPHVDHVNLDSERVVSRSSRDAVENHVPEQHGPYGGEPKGSHKVKENVHENAVRDDRNGGKVQEGGIDVVKGKDKVEATNLGLTKEGGAVNMEAHEDLQKAVHHEHQERVEERPRVANTSGHQDGAEGDKRDGRNVQKGVHQELSGIVNADIGEVTVEPAAHSGDVATRALVSDTELKPPRDDLSITSSSLPNGLVSALPEVEKAPRVSQIPVSERSTVKGTENIPAADEIVVAQTRVPAAEQASLGETNLDKAREHVGIPEDEKLVEEGLGEHVRAHQSVAGQSVLQLEDTNTAVGTREPVSATLPENNTSAAERPASKDNLEERPTSKISNSRNPPTSELAPNTSIPQASTSVSSLPAEGDAVLEPDHIDSLSELEESFGVRSPVKDAPVSRLVSPRPATPSPPPEISAPADALAHSPTLPAIERSPMLPPLAPLAPLSPILPSSPSVSPSPPEPLSPPTPSSPPTTSSPPGSPSPAASFAPPVSSALESRLSGPQSGLSSAKALSQDGLDDDEASMAVGALSGLAPSKAETPSELFSRHESSVGPELPDVPEAPAHSQSLSPEALLSPRLPSHEFLPSPQPVAPEQAGDDLSPSRNDASEPEETIELESSLGSELDSLSEAPPTTRPEPSNSPSREPSPLHEPAALPQASTPLEPSPSSRSLKMSKPSPSPASTVEGQSARQEQSSCPQSPVVSDSISAPLVPPLAEVPHLHGSPHLPTPSPSPSSESSFAAATTALPGPSPSNTSPFGPIEDLDSLSEHTPESVRSIPPSLLSGTAHPPETSESIILPASSELSSTQAPNSSVLPNASLPDVSLPLEPSSSPRLSPLEPAGLPESSLSLNSSTLHDSSPLISPPLFEPSPWPGLSIAPKPSPSSLPISPPLVPLPSSDHSYSPEPSPSHGPLPDVVPTSEHSVVSEQPPTEDLRGNERPIGPEFSKVERLGSQEHQEPPVTPERREIIPDPLSPWGSLRLRRAPGGQDASDDEQQLPKSSLLFDYASVPADSPSSSHTPLSRLPPLPEDSPLLEYTPPPGRVQSERYNESFEGERPEDFVDPVETIAVVSPERSGECRSHSPVEGSQLSQRSSLSEIPSLSEFAPPAIRSDTAPQYVRTTSLASEPRAASEPSPKPRPRSQLKPLRLSLLHGLSTSPPGAIITPVSANTTTPSPGFRSEAATPTPAAMYPTPSSAHPPQPSVSLKSGPRSPPTVEEPTEAHEPNGLDSVSWFGAKKGVKRGTLSAGRQSVRQSVQGSNRSSLSHDATAASPGRDSVPAAVEQPSPHSPVALSQDEDVRPLPRIWDDETEAGSRAATSRQGTQSPTQSLGRPVPMLEAFPPDTEPIDVAPPLKTPDRLDTVPRYPAFVNIGTNSPRISEGRLPLSSPPAISEHASDVPDVQQSEDEPTATRSRKWADTVDEGSIGSLPDFNAPVPSTQLPDGQLSERNEPHTPSKHKERRHYMKIPNTAPLSISPRRVSPSIMQRSQEEGMGSYEQSVSSQDEMRPYDMRMKEGTTGPWMAEYFTNSPSSFHSSQVGSMHSASSSLSTRAKIVGIRQSISSNKQVNGPVHVEDGTFGNPGPGPSTMKTYSERRQSAEVLGSPIALQSPPHERAPSLPRTPQQYALAEPASRVSRQLSSASGDVTPRKASGALQLRVSSAESVTEAVMTTPSDHPSAITQPPVQNHGNEVSPTEQRTPYKALSLSSPSPGRQPPTPLTAASPLQILRRNLMARTSPESPRFLSPQTRTTNLPEPRLSRHQHHASASLAPMTHMREDFRKPPLSAPGPRDRRSLTPNTRFAATPSIPGSPAQSVHSTISQSKPLLFFAIAKNSAQEVERLLQDGEVKPNDKAGPEDLPALAFALANEQLSDKTQIVKSLLSHGADPSSVLHRNTGSGQFDDADLALTTRIEQGMNPAIRYYLNRKQMTIPALQAELLEKNNFGGLTRAGFSIIGQDAALEELIRVVAGHCRRQALNPLVVVFSGGPGCGKSLLASKIGPLLHVPYFTVNMTNLRNEAALFNYISMTTKAGQPQIPLTDFLRNNQGQRCVVVLEEIEKAADKTVWHSLLMPWEWGKATVISPSTNEQIDIDTSQVIWIATSNSGDDATLKFFAERSRPSDRGESALVRLAHNPRSKEDNFTRKDYLQLMQAVRKRLGELLGSSMISRVSSVLPFLPFTEDEVYALASESLSAMRAEQKGDQSYENVDWEELLQQSVGEYIPGEGARSVHRAVQRAFDEIAEW